MRFRLLSVMILFSGIVSGQSRYDAILKAKALEEAGKSEQAIIELSGSLVNQKASSLYVARGDAEILAGKYSDALVDYNTANTIEKSSGEFGIARTYALTGDAANSLSHLEKNISSSFRKGEKEIMLDPTFEKIENSPEWRLFWKTERFTGAERFISDIEYYLAAGKVSDATETLSEIKRSYPGTPAADYAEALVNLSAGKYQAAVNLLTALLENNPGNPGYLKALAKGEESSGNPAGASVTYSKLIELEVPDAELFIRRAECFRRTGETSAALADIDKYLSIYPDSKSALSLAGKVETSAGDYNKALTYFTNNLKLHPGDPQCYIDRADAYMLSKSWDWAGRDYSMSLDLNPGNPVVWLNKGVALMRSGKIEDACHDFRQALSLGNKQAADYISRYCIK